MTPREELERLNVELNNPETLAAYRAPFDNYRISLIPHLSGGLLVFFGNLVYGRKPSYMKFRAIEVIARVPYHSWVSAAYTLLTLFYSNEERALRLTKVSRFARHAQDNETMHVVVISRLACLERKPNPIFHTIIPMLFALVYYWLSYLLYLINRKYALELNYSFENHAFHQYDEFLRLYEEPLKHKPVESEFLFQYGRFPRNQYEFFQSVRNDELVHRNGSIHEIATL